MGAWWIFLLFFCLIIVGGIIGAYQAEKRRKELAAWGATRDLRFDASKDYGVEDEYPEFDCFSQGSRRYGHNHLRGLHGDWPLHAFDYHYETYSTDSKGRRTTHHHHFSALVLEVGLPLRPLSIRPEHFFDKVGAFFGADDIDFESDEFSREFHVQSPDRRWAFDVIHQETMEFLLHQPRYRLQFGNHRVLVYRQSRFSAREYTEALELASGLIERLPKYLLRELKGVQS